MATSDTTLTMLSLKVMLMVLGVLLQVVAML